MSSTNRGAERRAMDFYPTPESAFTPILPFIDKLRVKVWEPACGDGRLIRWMVGHGIFADGTDLEKGTDFLTDISHRECIVTNPPFSLAFEFCKRAVQNADHVFMLLRLGFLASGGRRAWFMDNEPAALIVLCDRPSFAMSVKCAVECGYKAMLPIESKRPKECPNCKCGVKISTSDSADYAWVYWGSAFRGIFHV